MAFLSGLVEGGCLIKMGVNDGANESMHSIERGRRKIGGWKQVPTQDAWALFDRGRDSKQGTKWSNDLEEMKKIHGMLEGGKYREINEWT